MLGERPHQPADACAAPAAGYMMGHAGHPGAYPHGVMKHKKMKASSVALYLALRQVPCSLHRPRQSCSSCTAPDKTCRAPLAVRAAAAALPLQYKGVGGFGRHKFKRGGKFKRPRQARGKKGVPSVSQGRGGAEGGEAQAVPLCRPNSFCCCSPSLCRFGFKGKRGKRWGRGKWK